MTRAAAGNAGAGDTASRSLSRSPALLLSCSAPPQAGPVRVSLRGMDQWLSQLRGRFIVFDGPDGSGKTTQLRRFARRVAEVGVEACEVREPGGTAIGEQVRRILLDPANAGMDLHCEMLLYMASRAQLVHERIRPAMQAGQLVLADRFISSTLAYQGAAGGLSESAIREVARVAVGEAWPDLVVVFDVDADTAATRLNPLLDRMELKGRTYHRAVREGFLRQAEHEPQRYLVVDARGDSEAVFEAMMRALATRVADWGSECGKRGNGGEG